MTAGPQPRALAQALALARRGHAVFPLWWPRARDDHWICACKRGADCGLSAAKHPYGPLAPNGILSASADPAQIEGWFAREPRANLGLRTERLICLDIDPRHEGDAALRALEREHGDFPTWRSRTGGGGEHVLFAAPEAPAIPSSQARDKPLLGPGIDIRAKGGYIVSPPSRHANGRYYTWDIDAHPDDIPLAPAPQWLLARLAPPPAAAAAPPDWARLASPIEAYADAAAARVCGHLLRRYVDPSLAAGLLYAWNRAYARPALDEADLRRLFERIHRLELERRAREGSGHAR